MNLREYLFRKHLKVTEFSKVIQCNRSYLNDIVNGIKKPGMRLAKEIERETNGEVTVKELMEGSKSEEKNEENPFV